MGIVFEIPFPAFPLLFWSFLKFSVPKELFRQKLLTSGIGSDNYVQCATYIPSSQSSHLLLNGPFYFYLGVHFPVASVSFNELVQLGPDVAFSIDYLWSLNTQTSRKVLSCTFIGNMVSMRDLCFHPKRPTIGQRQENFFPIYEKFYSKKFGRN